jgi:hypothetical protein
LNIQQLQGNEQALEQAMGQFLQEMQSAQKARFGAKLNYIRTLKGNAPEGMVVEYYKCGGQTKKRFVKAAGGEKVKDGKKEIEDFKKKKACKGSSLKFELGGEAPKEKKSEKPQQRLDPKTTKKLPGGKYPSYWTSKERQTWERLHGDNDEGAGTVENKGIGKNCNGGKARKHFFGGSLVPFYQHGTSKGGLVYNMTKPYMFDNNEYVDLESRPDKFGRYVSMSRQVSPRNDGTFNNDTTYYAFIHDNNGEVTGSGNYFINQHGNHGDGLTPKTALNRPFNNWRDYFEHLLQLKK